MGKGAWDRDAFERQQRRLEEMRSDARKNADRAGDEGRWSDAAYWNAVFVFLTDCQQVPLELP